MAQQYGITPWGKWFIDVLDSYKMDARLARGKSYANTGKVAKLIIDGMTASAKVAGHSSPWYTVKITFPKLAEADDIYALIEKNPMLLSRIASGELPIELLEKLKKKDIALIPKKWNQMKRSCSCPDWGDPCKHMAAVYYIIAREIDHDPLTLFKLRGIDLSSRFGSSAIREIKPPFVCTYDKMTDNSKRDLPITPYVLPEFGNYLAFIKSLLLPSPSFSERDLKIVLFQFYHQAERAFWTIPEDNEKEHRFSQADWSVNGEETMRIGAPLELVMTPKRGDAQKIDLLTAASFFLGFSSDEGTPGYRFLFNFFRLMRTLCLADAYAPFPLTDEKYLSILWQPLHTVSQVAQALDSLALYEPSLFPVTGRPKKLLSGRSAIDLLAASFCTSWVKHQKFSVSGSGGAVFQGLVDLFFSGLKMRIDSPAFHSLPFAIDAWLSVLAIDFSSWKYRFALKEASAMEESSANEESSASEKSHPNTIAELPSFKLTMAVLSDHKPIPLKDAVKKTGDMNVLKAPTALAAYLPEIRDLSRKASVVLDETRLVNFLDNASDLLSRLGVEVVLPKSLHRELKPRLVMIADAKKTGSLTSFFNLNTLLSYEWSVAIGDTVMSQKEFALLVKQKRALVAFNDGFIRLDAEEVSRLLKQAQSAKPPSEFDLLKARITGDAILSTEAETLVGRLFEERDFPEPVSLKAVLRPYQARGYRWICSLLTSGFGCILADDMGLGKTVQAIAAILRLREDALLPGGTLIVAPAALLANWERELARFAPDLGVSRFHGTGRSLSAKSDVILTTFQTAVRSEEKLAERNFSLLIVDEAHLMKNAQTRASKTVKALTATFRLALSGTPVENHLEDLRSLFDFALPGYLGTSESFKKEYRIPIEVDRKQDRAKRLQDITRPFLLRRLKTDKTIISDLPDKVTINEYATLGKEQAALYESLVRVGIEESEHVTEGLQRSAMILKLLTGLKQVCDHPRVYDKESPSDAGLSGKCGLMLALLGDMLANREKVLIFSQYVETLTVLETVIADELDETALVYHGGLSQKKRDAIVESFQNDDGYRIMLVSLKAGGLGLNLTAASRVIHFDLWYNPAVENQATDRAFRIGQTKNVFVHRFITTGTFEEKIDSMLASKRELADMTVSSGESWLAKMSHTELKELFG